MKSTVRCVGLWIRGLALATLGCLVGCGPREPSRGFPDRDMEATTMKREVGRESQGQYAPVNGLRMYYEVHGRAHAGKPPLVLLHGGGSTIGTSFGQVLHSLAASRQVIAFEQQGHGHTGDVDRPFSFEQTADDTAALIRYLKIESADLLGWSNGGSAALQVAIRHPALVRKLVVASAMFKRDGLPPEFWGFMEQATPESMPAELREAYLRVAPNPEALPTMHEKSVQRMLGFTDWLPEVIRSIRAPVLVAIADSDVVRLEHAVEMYRLLPNAQLAVLPGTDHDILNRRPDWVVSMVSSFLDAPMPGTE